MTLAAFLPPRLLVHVRHVFPHESDMAIAESWEDLDRLIRRTPVRAVILDPSADGVMKISEVQDLMTRYPSLPLIGYLALSAPGFKAIAQLAREGLRDVVLHRFDDSPERFRERVESVQSNPVTREVLDILAPKLARLPRTIARAVEELFDQPHRYRTAMDLAHGAGVAVVVLYRNFHLAELGSPKRLISAARQLKAYTYMRDPGYTIVDVSTKLGYRSTRIFTEHALSIFGLTPGRVRARISEEEALRLVLAWIRSGAADAVEVATE